jgi:hypothetical protein
MSCATSRFAHSTSVPCGTGPPAAAAVSASGAGDTAGEAADEGALPLPLPLPPLPFPPFFFLPPPFPLLSFRMYVDVRHQLGQVVG